MHKGIIANDLINFIDPIVYIAIILFFEGVCFFSLQTYIDLEKAKIALDNFLAMKSHIFRLI